MFRTELAFIDDQSHASGSTILHQYKMFEQATRQREQLSDKIGQKLQRLVKRIDNTQKESNI